MIHELAQWLVDTIFDLGYLGIFLLMSIESSFIPFPSEIVLIPAGYLASKGEMSVVLIMFSAIGGSLLGAYINYFGALWVGRTLLERYGRYVFIKLETLEKMDRFFAKHGHISTFTGRLIPGIRQLISIPALGAGIWSLILVILGYLLGEHEELVKSYLSQITVVAVISAVVMLILYFYIQKRKVRRKTEKL